MILSKVAADIPEATSNLDIDIGSEVFVNRLLDQAREAIAELNLQSFQETRQLEVQVQRDELTGLYNRSYLNQYLQKQFELSRKLEQPLTMIFLDIDNFKVINYSCGHHAGDTVLISVARVLQTVARRFDTVVRFGGDEFVILLENSDEDTGIMVSERIRASVEGQPHQFGEEQCMQVTVSVGCATMSANSSFSSPKELLEAADRSLYAAKSSGRNRVVQAQ